jgi:hypothetical protein
MGIFSGCPIGLGAAGGVGGICPIIGGGSNESKQRSSRN